MKVKMHSDKFVTLLTNDEDKSLVLSQFEIFGGGSFKCKVTLKSRRFGYDGCLYFDNGVLFIEALESMAIKLKGRAELKEDYSDHLLKFEVTNLGHVIVSGLFVEYSEHSQNMSFEFKTDQTCLLPFANSLKGVIA